MRSRRSKKNKLKLIYFDWTICHNINKIKNKSKLEYLIFSKKISLDFSEFLEKNILKVGKFELSPIKIIGRGAYSHIYELRDERYKVSLALKVEHSQIPSEVDIIAHLEKKGCNTVQQRYIGQDNDHHYYLMNLAQGTLENLKDNLKLMDNKQKIKFVIHIVEQIRHQIVCLYKLGYIYTDFKLDNIFYDCPTDNRGHLRIFLGDLGSAVQQSDNKYIASYPPYEHANNNGRFKLKTKAEKKAVLSWGLGIIFFLLMTDEQSLSQFYFTEALTSEYYMESIGKLGKFRSYLSIDPQHRPSIYKSFE